MYRAACKVEFQPLKRSYSQLTFFDLYKIKKLHMERGTRSIKLRNILLKTYMENKTR